MLFNFRSFPFYTDFIPSCAAQVTKASFLESFDVERKDKKYCTNGSNE